MGADVFETKPDARAAPPASPSVKAGEGTTVGTKTSRVEVGVSDSPPPGTDDAKVERPAWLPEKFKTAEDLAKSYLELQKKLGGETPPPPADAASTITPPPAITKDATDKVVADAGVDIAKLEAEYVKNGGKLSDETVKALEAKGLTKDLQEAIIRGRKASADEYAASVADSVGGKEKMAEIFKWAAKNMPAHEIDAVNASLASMNAAQARLALEAVKTRFESANGREPGLVNGAAGTGSTGVKPFESNDEIVAAMRDPRYKSGDPAYHAIVAKRLAASDIGTSRRR